MNERHDAHATRQLELQLEIQRGTLRSQNRIAWIVAVATVGQLLLALVAYFRSG